MNRMRFLLAILWTLPALSQSEDGRFAAQLESLEPSRPSAYYELAETVAGQAASPADVQLARRLFVLAYSLGSDPNAPAWLRASSCIALASLERDASRRRWLFAVAAILDDRYAALDRGDLALEGFSQEQRLAFAEYLGLVRSGRGVLARARLEQPGMQDLLDAVSAIVLGTQNAPSLARMRGESSVWPCKQCSNARSVPDASDPDTKRILCPNCRGNPGPLLSNRDRISFVALEAIALRADGRTWSAEHAMLRTAALLDPDPEGVASFYQIDTSRSVYKSGVWKEAVPEKGTQGATQSPAKDR
ncbi:MAG: hypothetical protein AAGJ54_04635 [Planctomycetota bacterium]